jgi:hypothetical protein
MDESVVISEARERCTMKEEILTGVIAGHKRALT